MDHVGSPTHWTSGSGAAKPLGAKLGGRDNSMMSARRKSPEGAPPHNTDDGDQKKLQTGNLRADSLAELVSF